MKRKLLLVAGAAAVSIMAYFGSHGGAQGPAAAPPVQPCRTRIAFVNLNLVIKNYAKTKAFEDEFKAELQQWDAKGKPVKDKYDILAKAIQGPSISAEQKESLTNQAKACQRELQDMQETMKAQLGKKQVAQLGILYREIKLAVETFAKARDVELVMTYADVTPEVERDHPEVIERKIFFEGARPLYWHPEMEITSQITQMLNDYYAKTSGIPAGGVTRTSAPGGN